MAGKPIATVGSMHVCPLCSGTVPHVGGPVSGPGQPKILINGKPVATVGDMCTCTGPPDTIVQGNPTILVNGKPIACVGDMTAHGGAITVGEVAVVVSTASIANKTALPLKNITFPKLRLLDDIGAALIGKGKQHKEAKENINKMKTEAQKNRIELSDLLWKKDDTEISKAPVGETVCLSAKVSNAEEGTLIAFKIYEKDEKGEDDYVDSLIGIVKNSRIEIDWKVRYVEDNDDVESAKELQDKNFTLPEYVFKYCNPNTSEIESNLLEVVDVLEVKFIDGETGEPVPNLNYAISLPDGTFLEGTIDENGYAIIEDLRASENYPIVFFNDEGPILTANS